MKSDVIKKWYSQVFAPKHYNNDSYIDYHLYDADIDDWEFLINKLRKEFKVVAMNFNGQLLPNDFQIKMILNREDKNDFFLEIYLKNITLRIYTNSIDMIEGDVHRSKIKNIEYFTEFVFFLKDINTLLSKKIYIYNEMDEEKPIFTIG